MSDCVARYNFSSWAPDAMVIDLGTNDMRAITKIGASCPVTLSL